MLFTQASAAEAAQRSWLSTSSHLSKASKRKVSTAVMHWAFRSLGRYPTQNQRLSHLYGSAGLIAQ
ncbi:hypothetical protein FOTG_13017 [Fusarium oxysporum f. sp. vasinfectum 25433]|uniref:Uncharacterized protein n=1 Tax=Fusarium oxysporum f. sp. vasinfectum 25433 TaxID=1089449 RepID=X0LCY0_FUSOX|nr:hypothetical protein FOTG_13017 [Fusarium oxysporum f. sp. vasinfectum 25433]